MDSTIFCMGGEIHWAHDIMALLGLIDYWLYAIKSLSNHNHNIDGFSPWWSVLNLFFQIFQMCTYPHRNWIYPLCCCSCPLFLFHFSFSNFRPFSRELALHIILKENNLSLVSCVSSGFSWGLICSIMHFFGIPRSLLQHKSSTVSIHFLFYLV